MDKKMLWVGLALGAVVVLAAFLRFYDITNYPPGLFPDEAANGEDVLLIFDGDVRPFYPRGNGREALFFYLQALMVKLFGLGVWPMHAASALVGTATVAAMYFATRPWFGRLSGLLAAFFLATSHWHITLSRTGFRAIMIPLFVVLFTAFVGYLIREVKAESPTPSRSPSGRGRKSLARSYVYAALAGVALAGGFYTYIAYRVMMAVVLVMAILILLDDWILESRQHVKIHARDLPHLTRYWRQLLVSAVAAVIVLLPLGWYFAQEPAAFVGRAGQVSVFNPDLQEEFGGGTLQGTLLYSFRATAMSFFAGEGDLNWRHNVAGYPLLNPLVGVLFLLGVTWAIHGTVRVGYSIVRGEEVHLGMVYPYILLLLGGMLLPVITTAEGMPHGLRSVGMVAPIFILAGTAGSVVLYWLRRRVISEWGQTALLGVAAGVLLVSGAYGPLLYFEIARNDPAAYFAYRGDLAEVADYINQNAEARPYIVLDGFNIQSIHFLTAVAAHDLVPDGAPHPDEAQHRWRQVDPARSHVTTLRAGESIIFTLQTMPDADRYSSQHPTVELVEQRYNRFGQEIMRVYKALGNLDTPDSEAPEALDA